MKRKWVINGFLCLWAIAIIVFVVKNMVSDLQKQKGENISPYVEDNLTIEATVGDIEEEIISNKDSEKTANKVKNNNKSVKVNTVAKTEIVQNEVVNNEEEIKVREEKYGTVIYDKITYKMVNNERVKIKKETIIDASSYNASLKELKKEALELLANNRKTADEILEYTNNYRKEVNRNNLLSLDDDLTLTAMIRALELAYSNNFTHQRPDGSYVDKLVKDLNIKYKSLGENIAYGYKNALAVSVGWRNSEGHYKNMINDKYHKVGIATFTLNNNTYFVQVFSD